MGLATDGEFQEYELNVEDVRRLGLAAKAIDFKQAQEMSNLLWQDIAKKMNFQWDSVRRHPFKGSRFILAKPIALGVGDSDD